MSFPDFSHVFKAGNGNNQYSKKKPRKAKPAAAADTKGKTTLHPRTQANYDAIAEGNAKQKAKAESDAAAKTKETGIKHVASMGGGGDSTSYDVVTQEQHEKRIDTQIAGSAKGMGRGLKSGGAKNIEVDDSDPDNVTVSGGLGPEGKGMAKARAEASLTLAVQGYKKTKDAAKNDPSGEVEYSHPQNGTARIMEIASDQMYINVVFERPARSKKNDESTQDHSSPVPQKEEISVAWRLRQGGFKF